MKTLQERRRISYRIIILVVKFFIGCGKRNKIYVTKKLHCYEDADVYWEVGVSVEWNFHLIFVTNCGLRFGLFLLFSFVK